MNLQIASADEQQSPVAEDISRNVSVMHDCSESLAAQIEEANE